MTTTRHGDQPTAGSPPAAASPPTAGSPPAGAVRQSARPGPGDDAGAARSPAAQDRAERSTTSGLTQLATIVGAVVAPTTLLTTLLFYFGWSHAYWFFDYFGVHSTVLGLTTQDYVQRSLDGLFVPLLAVACAGLAVLWGHATLRDHLVAGAHPRLARCVVPAMAVGGLVLVAGGLSSVVATTALDAQVAAAPVSLAVGVLLLVYVVHLRRALTADRAAPPQWVGVAEWSAVFVLVGLSLFWAATDYSAAVGRSRARQLVEELPTYPDAVVYSNQSLSLAAPGVREVRCQGEDAAYRFRYEGLKLVLHSGDQYLFLPEAWSRANGVAIVMPRNDSLRLEFVPASASRDPALRPTC